MERRTANHGGVKLRAQDGKAPVIEGYAAVYYNGTAATEYELWSGMVERIMPGTFDRAILEDDVRALFNHDPSQLLGRSKAGTLRLSSDAKGLRYEIDQADTNVGRDVATHIQRGDISGSSFAMIVTDENWRKESGKYIREVRGVKLFDAGPVTYPAYAGTSSAVRSESDAAEARKSLERWQASQVIIPTRTAVLARARAVEIENGP